MLKEKKAEYNKEYYEKNKDRLKEQKAEYGAKNKDKINKQRRIYRGKNKNEINSKKRLYAEKHRDKKREQDKRYSEKNKGELKKKRAVYYEKNKDKINKQRKIYREENKDKIREQKRLDREKNKDYIREKKKKYYKENKNKIVRTAVEHRKKSRMIDSSKRALDNCRSRIRAFIKNLNKEGLRVSKLTNTLELLGCTKDFLKEYLESKFKPGMTWENYGLHGWHIDHVRPCNSFKDFNNIETQKECFNYINLQPLWADDNLRKGKKEVT